MLIDTTPLPDNIPQVQEIGASSAPLLSASFFIGARCRDYNDDYMQCKTENPGKGELNCLKEGRRVTRCAQSVYVFFCPFPLHVARETFFVGFCRMGEERKRLSASETSAAGRERVICSFMRKEGLLGYTY